jgi:hypothetical protein
MPRKRHKAEEIVAKLRQVDVLVSQGQSVADAIRQAIHRTKSTDFPRIEKTSSRSVPYEVASYCQESR